ncbi:MAG: patatin-like phospholipase family protein [Vicinamibacterales bacterium]|jgi:NTE family protein|nr:patatin-like phospholipase family protein [Vicinamibacterales bacterium]
MTVPAGADRGAPERDDLALVLVGGGARAAYQVGFLRSLIRLHPGLWLPIITGTSAGAINAAYLAAHAGSLTEAVSELSQLWHAQRVDQVFRVDNVSLLSQLARWGFRLVSGGGAIAPNVQGLLDTAPLRVFLNRTLTPSRTGEISGIAENIAAGRLRALAITTSSYSTGQSVIWVQGSDIQGWERPNRRSRKTAITVDHVMASSALPLFFPAIRLDDGWYGDGGIRMMTPCSPAIHLGARRIIAVSNRCRSSMEDADRPLIQGYPPPAQIAGQLVQAMFLDDLDRDWLNLERLNRLLETLPPEKRQGLRPVELVVIRPSQDLGRLSRQFEPQLPKLFRHLTRGLGSRETASPDLVSLLMFQPDYIARLMEIGEADADAAADRIAALLDADAADP